eukprot:RCo010190
MAAGSYYRSLLQSFPTLFFLGTSYTCSLIVVASLSLQMHKSVRQQREFNRGIFAQLETRLSDRELDPKLTADMLALTPAELSEFSRDASPTPAAAPKKA